jgi:hypothetical protein
VVLFSSLWRFWNRVSDHTWENKFVTKFSSSLNKSVPSDKSNRNIEFRVPVCGGVEISARTIMSSVIITLLKTQRLHLKTLALRHPNLFMSTRILLKSNFVSDFCVRRSASTQFSCKSAHHSFERTSIHEEELHSHGRKSWYGCGLSW